MKHLKMRYLAVIIIMRIHWAKCDYRNHNVDLTDLPSLSELPIEKLLLLRQTLKQEIPVDQSKKKPSGWIQPNQYKPTDKEPDSDGPKPKDQTDRTSYGWGPDLHDSIHHYDHDNMLWFKSKGNIQTIFQTTVTVLAFLAFGGYLVCLILTTFHGGPKGAIVVQSTTTTDNRVVKRDIDIAKLYYRQSIRAPVNNTEEDSEMYALCQIAEGYTKYHLLVENRDNA